MSWPHIIGARDTPPNGLTPAERYLLLVVATYTNGTGRAWPKVDTLAGATGYHPGHVRRLIADLAADTPPYTVTTGLGITAFNLAHLARPARASGPNSARKMRDIEHKENKNQAAARVEGVDISLPAAWLNLADPRDRAAIEQLRLEVD